MNYQDIRSEIRSGDILAFSHFGWSDWRDWVGELIKFVTRSQYTHLATAWVVGDRVFVIEAVLPVVRIYPLSLKGDFTWIPMNSTWKSTTETAALSYVGYPYSILDAIESVFKEPTHEHGWECAEIAKYLANLDGAGLKSTPTPGNIIRELQWLGKELKFVTNPG